MPGTDSMRIWELISVLIVPGALLVTAIWLNNAQIRREETVTNQHAQDEALRQYLDQMCNLLIDERLREQPSEPGAYALAQA